MYLQAALTVQETKGKGKTALLQQTYGGAGERGGIAPTHSRPRH
jgi:hypothetical protein